MSGNKVLLTAILKGRDNNLNLIRFLLATAVLYTHSYVLLGQADSEVMTTLGISKHLSFFAVDGFFIISGFLIYFSAQKSLNSGNWQRYIKARILRIYPAMIVMVLIFAVIIAPLISPVPTTELYFGRQMAKFVVFNTTLIFNLVYTLPGVFAQNITPAIFGSAWTLPYELLCYIFCPLVLWFGRAGNRRYLIFVLAMIAWTITTSHLVTAESKPPGPFTYFYLQQFAACFLTGMIFARYAGLIALRHTYAAMALLGLAVLNYFDPAFYGLTYLLHLMLFAYLLFYLAHFPRSAFKGFNRLGDYSYGIYIWSFPVQQLLISASLSAQPHPLALFLNSFVITLLLAVLSWHLVEKRALGYVAGHKKPGTV